MGNGLRDKPLKYLTTRSKTLLIPEDFLTSGAAYNVSVEVKNENKVLAKVREETCYNCYKTSSNYRHLER